MALWAVLGLMTAAAMMAVLWPLSRRPAVAGLLDLDTRFYRDQIAEIDRDLERGLISRAEAESAKAEAGRRLLRANASAAAAADGVAEPALRRRRAASALALSTVPLLALAVYGAYGSPHLPGLPLSARLQADPGRVDVAAAVARIEAHLTQNPQDGRGWEVVAPVYLRSGRIEDGVRAYEAALRLLGDTAPRLAAYGEAIVSARDGLVVTEARAAFEQALKLDPADPKARFYLAEAAEQDGDVEAARRHFADLVAASPAGAPWLPLVKERLARLKGTGPGPALAAAPAQEREAAIRGMVEGLAARLESSGGTVEDWARLVRSYAVLGEPDQARSALGKARQALASSTDAAGRLQSIAQELKLEPTRDAQARTP